MSDAEATQRLPESDLSVSIGTAKTVSVTSRVRSRLIRIVATLAHRGTDGRFRESSGFRALPPPREEAATALTSSRFMKRWSRASLYAPLRRRLPDIAPVG